MASPHPAADVTLVMPAYNRAGLITRALDSVRRQQHWPRELIVVDDASTDATAAAVTSWRDATGFPVRLERLSRNGGAAAARNHGIALARTRFVAFLDSDDEHLGDTVARLGAALRAHPDAVVAFGDATKLTASARLPGAMFRARAGREAACAPRDPASALYLLHDAKSTLLRASLIPTCSAAFRRADALAVGGMPTAFRTGEDWLFWLRLSERGDFLFIDDDLSLVHRHPDNLTSPASAAHTTREKLVGYLALLDGTAGVRLDAAQRAALKGLLRERAALLRYQASRLGLPGYLRATFGVPGYPRGAAMLGLLADPKSLLRAAAASCTRLPQVQAE